MDLPGKLSSQFPLTQQYTYLNTPAYGLLFEGLMEWRQEHDLDHLVGGSRFKEAFIKDHSAIRSTVGSFTGADPQEVYLVPNFSFGWKVLCAGLEKKLHVLLLDGDYPSLNWPVLTGGFDKLGKIAVSYTMEESILQYFEREVPDVFAFSLVQYLNGLKLDLDFIRRLKASYPGTLFIADGTQYMGTEQFSFQDSGIDVLGASGYKWLLGGTGNGFFLVRSSVEKRFYNQTLVWEPRKEPFLKENTHLQNHLEPGHIDSMCLGSLKYSMDYLATLGMEKVEKKVKELNGYAAGLLCEAGFLDEEVLTRPSHGSMFSLDVNSKQIAALEQRHVVFAIRGGRLRVGFHFYNEKEEVEKLVKILKHSVSR